MADFRTPLPIHRAAFARIAPTLIMSKDGLEDLRAAFQAAERSGDARRCWRDVSDALARHVFSWPWLEMAAVECERQRVWPLTWALEKVPRPFNWHLTTHAARTNLTLAALHSALQTEKALAAYRQNAADGAVSGRLVLAAGDDRCGASVDAQMRFSPQVQRGELSQLPPYFPGDHTMLRFELDIPKRRR